VEFIAENKSGLHTLYAGFKIIPVMTIQWD